MKRKHIKIVQEKLNLTQDIISDRTTQALALILKYIKAKKSGGCCCSCGCSGCSTAFKCSDKEINKN